MCFLHDLFDWSSHRRTLGDPGCPEPPACMWLTSIDPFGFTRLSCKSWKIYILIYGAAGGSGLQQHNSHTRLCWPTSFLWTTLIESNHWLKWSSVWTSLSWSTNNYSRESDRLGFTYITENNRRSDDTDSEMYLLWGPWNIKMNVTKQCPSVCVCLSVWLCVCLSVCVWPHYKCTDSEIQTVILYCVNMHGHKTSD